tara:strand:- start:1075 stop:1662 length:588 start_codon:yes stop_codon:yes gene_type:complete
MKKSNIAKIAAKKAHRAAKSKAKKTAFRKVANMKVALKDIAPPKSFQRVQKVSKEKLDTWTQAYLDNTAHLLDTKPCKLLSLRMIAISMKDFLEANDNSTQKSFNRSFHKDLFVKEVARKNNVSISEAMNRVLICVPFCTHSYRAMSECETHYRCEIVYSASDKVGFDMSIEDYQKLYLIDDANPASQAYRARAA